MKYANELQYYELRNECFSKQFSFESTSEIEPLEEIIGQERAVKAMGFGLKIGIRGYNIYMSGTTGTGKTSYASNHIKKLAQKGKVPDDWCYIYNFDKPHQPTAINLPAGLGKIFQKDMDECIKILKAEISKAFDSEDYENERNAIDQEYEQKRGELIEKLNKDAERHGFKVKINNTGIYFMPIVDGKILNEEEYNDLNDVAKEDITERSSIIQKETTEIIRKIKNVERELENKLEEWENKIALFAVGMNLSDLKDKYIKYTKIIEYLDKLQEDILSNLSDFREAEVSEEQQVLAQLTKRAVQSPADKYQVNLLIDNSELTGAPVIVDFNPTYYNLMGKLEYENEFGALTTDFTKLKAGLFHQANGGYLILQAKDIVSNVQSWEALKRVLKTKQINIENMKEQLGLVAVSTLKPEPIPLNIKLILVGSEYIYQTLYEYDEDFKKLFKIKVDFDDEMERTDENVYKLSQFISAFCRREETLHFDRTGVAKVIEHSSKLVEDQNKLSTRLNDIAELLCESCAWAEIEGAEFVSEQHVKKALEEKKFRSDKYDKKLLAMLEEGTIMIDTEGEVVGQINGLSVLDMGDYSFGKPSRITANTYIGESGIVNIEREIEMSGTSHSKGVLILSGYIGQKYAQEMPLSLAGSLCFEQLYSGVDGDSASSAELYAILSSLADIPINQSLSVTGSVNQKGEIQPIGGVTNKVEGFYELCKSRGLNGKQGVIIPHQNIKNLVLCDEVIEAVKKGLFHIYPIKTIDEGIEILTGKKAGNKKADGTYPKGTINYKVYEKLKKYASTVSYFDKKEKATKSL